MDTTPSLLLLSLTPWCVPTHDAGRSARGVFQRQQPLGKREIERHGGTVFTPSIGYAGVCVCVYSSIETNKKSQPCLSNETRTARITPHPAHSMQSALPPCPRNEREIKELENRIVAKGEKKWLLFTSLWEAERLCHLSLFVSLLFDIVGRDGPANVGFLRKKRFRWTL